MNDDPVNPANTAGRERGRYARILANGYQLRVDGATAYRVRLLPSNKELGRFPTSSEAVRLVERELLAGRHERTLALDWSDEAGHVGKIAAGHSVTHLAESMIGRRSRLIVAWGERGAHSHEIAADFGEAVEAGVDGDELPVIEVELDRQGSVVAQAGEE